MVFVVGNKSVMGSEEPNKSLSWFELWELTYKGVDHTLPGNGGPECVNFISLPQRILECVLFGVLGLFEVYVAFRRIRLPVKIRPDTEDWVGRRILLMLMCLTFGAELGFKFATKQLIWVLNPCHLVSMIQIFLLTAPANQFTTAMFRIHMHILHGAVLAMIFPVINTRLLPCEIGVYYIQHILILVIPYFLLKHGGVYTVEPLTDFNWCMLSSGFLFFYHFVPLQFLAMNTEVNLNNMLCPAISDPFYGRHYRVCAAIHQTALLMIHGKIYTLLSSLVLPLKGFLFPKDNSAENCGGELAKSVIRYPEEHVWDSVSRTVTTTDKSQNNHYTSGIHSSSNNLLEKNGHVKIH